MGALRLAGPGWIVVAVAAIACGRPAGVDPCVDAYAHERWDDVVARCPVGSDRVALARAYRQLGDHHAADAATAAEALLTGPVAADAAYLAGYVRAQDEDPSRVAHGRELLVRALAGFQRVGAHGKAAKAASFLARVPRPEAHFEDALTYARLASAEAELAQDDGARARAATTLAELYDEIGLAEDARDAFFDAEEHARPWPSLLAHTYLQHGLFLIDLGGERDLRAALGYLAEARAHNRAGGDATPHQRRAIEVAVQLNRASALAELGEVDAALAELTEPPADAYEARRLALVRGFVAARVGDLPAAAALFAAADLGEVELDLRGQVALELARAYRRAGDAAAAERYYREAIAAVEALRQGADRPELRPWILAARTRPYLELLGLLAEAERGLDALVVAESLHARAWLDAALARDRHPLDAAAQSLLDARVRQRQDAGPALDRASLLARLDGREAVVLLAIDDAAWRVHVRGGAATIAALTTDQIAAVGRWRRAPGEPALATAAAAALLPRDVTTRADPLYVVTSDALADLPFAALRVDGQFVIAARPIVRLPGLAALGCRDGAWTDERVLVGDARGDLPHAADEVRRLAGAHARLGAAADRAAVTASARAALLHAAVHGRGGGLELADGLVTPADVLDQQLAPRTVVLTGCDTAAGADAEAWSSFPSAFLAAGSRHVVATLRSVPDDAAAEVVRAYYAQPEPLGPAARLAAAQRQVAATVRVDVWAAFTVWGDAACGP
ncbi:MAG: CHAT domain-containing protein [Myxococcales bacterium]|nr:CHAT domain-containing protein [Myxococcales bacterium]